MADSMDSLKSALDGTELSLSNVSIDRLGDVLSQALGGILSSFLPRIFEYMSGLMTDITGVANFSNTGFVNRLAGNSYMGAANAQAAMDTGIISQEGYLLQYAQSMGFKGNDPALAKGFLDKTGQLGNAMELAQISANKGRSGGIDPNAVLADTSWNSQMELFNESLKKAREGAATGELSYLFKGMDTSKMTAQELSAVVTKEYDRINEIEKNPEKYSREEVEEAKATRKRLNKSQFILDLQDAREFGNLSEEGLSAENQAKLAKRVEKNVARSIMSPELAAEENEKEARKTLADKSLKAAKDVAKTEFADVFREDDISGLTHTQMQARLDLAREKIVNDKSLSEEERKSKLEQFDNSETVRNVHAAAEFSGRRTMSDENKAQLVEETGKVARNNPQSDALRRQELAGGFGMLVQQAAQKDITDPKKAVQRMQDLVQSAGGFKQATKIMSDWASSDQFEKDVDAAFANDPKRKKEVMRKLYSSDAKEAEEARAEIAKTVMDYTEQTGKSTGLSRDISLQHQAVAAFGGNAQAAQETIAVVEAAFGKNARTGTTEQMADSTSRVIEYLRQISGTAEDFVKGIEETNRSIEEMGIESTDINGNPKQLAAQLYTASLGINAGMRKAGVGDPNVANAAAAEFARDLAGAKGYNEMGAMAGYLTDLEDAEGNKRFDQKQVEDFFVKAAKEKWSPTELREKAKEEFGADVIDQMNREFVGMAGLKKHFQETGTGMLSQNDDFIQAAHEATFGEIFFRGLHNGLEGSKAMGEAKNENLDAIMADKEVWDQMTAAGLSKEKIEKWKKDKSSVSAEDARDIEMLSKLDIKDENVRAQLKNTARHAHETTEGNFNAGGHDTSGKSGARAAVTAINDQASRALNPQTGTSVSTEAQAEAAAGGANTDRVEGSAGVQDLVEQGSREVESVQAGIERAEKMGEGVNEIADSVSKKGFFGTIKSLLPWTKDDEEEGDKKKDEKGKKKEEQQKDAEKMGSAIQECTKALQALTDVVQKYLMGAS